MTLIMRRISLVQWSKVLFGAAVVVTGCDDIESYDSNDIEMRDHDQAETGGDPLGADAQADVDEAEADPNAQVIVASVYYLPKPRELAFLYLDEYRRRAAS